MPPNTCSVVEHDIWNTRPRQVSSVRSCPKFGETQRWPKKSTLRPNKKVFDWRNPTDPRYPADPRYFFNNLSKNLNINKFKNNLKFKKKKLKKDFLNFLSL